MRRTLPTSLLALLLALAGTASARFGMPDALTERGRTIEGIYANIFVAGLVVFIVVMALMAWVLWRYREGTGHGHATYESHRHSTFGEVTWTVIPLIIVLWVGWISYVGLVELDEGVPLGEEDMEIRIVASQWNWEAVYPGGISVFADPGSSDGAVARENHFIVPAGKDILLNMTSLDVIHALHLMDSNRATVGLVDANPGGDHKYNHMMVKLEPGVYPVQCREMCFNPGHAYMRATFEAVPEAEYLFWKETKLCTKGAGLEETIQAEFTATGWSPGENLTVVEGTKAAFIVNNTAGFPISVDAGAGTTPVQIRAGDRGLVCADLQAVGSYRLSVSDDAGQVPGGVLNIASVSPDVTLDVDLGAFTIDPETLEFEAGKTYLINLVNTHTTAHNLYIGTFSKNAASKDVLAQSASINPGQSTKFVFTPEATGDLDMWCDIGGHYDAGMHGDVHVV